MAKIKVFEVKNESGDGYVNDVPEDFMGELRAVVESMEVGESYTVRLKEMDEEEFRSLLEFDGF